MFNQWQGFIRLKRGVGMCGVGKVTDNTSFGTLGTNKDNVHHHYLSLVPIQDDCGGPMRQNGRTNGRANHDGSALQRQVVKLPRTC